MPFVKAITSVLLVRYIPYILVIPILLFQALSLSGCVSTSPQLPNLFIVSITKNITSYPEIRVGYFGMCTTSNETGTQCVTTARSTAEAVLPSLFPDFDTTKPQTGKVSTDDLTTLLTGAFNLQSHVFNPVLAASGVLFLVAVILLYFAKRALKGGVAQRAQHLRLALFSCLLTAIAVNLTSCLSITEAVWALQYSPLLSGTTGEGATIISQGIELQTLQWFAFGMMSLFTASVPWLLKGGARGGSDKHFDA